MKTILSMGICGMTFACTAIAMEPAASSASQTQVEAWLQLQVSGKAASSSPQAQTPAERDLSLQRWLNSYQHPIPDFYEQRKGGSVSGSGQ